MCEYLVPCRLPGGKREFNLNSQERIPPKPDLLCTDVDYKGVVYGTQLAIHFMRKNQTPGGSIVVTASAAAVTPHETYPEYDGAKAAVCVSLVCMEDWPVTETCRAMRAPG